MKRSLSFILIIASYITFSISALAGVRVAIDAGHGGFDKGAIQAKIHESSVALSISQKLYRRLKKDSTLDPFLTRNGDHELKLHTRVRKAKRSRAQVFLSIHANSSPNPKASGAEFYIQSQMPPEEEMLFLAKRENDISRLSDKSSGAGGSNVQNILFDLKKNQRILDSYALSKALNRAWFPGRKRSTKIRQGPFYVLSQNEMPAVLVEVGYLSHSKERKRLLQSDYQNEIVEKIYKGLKSYLNQETL